jgi:cell division septum initiation protein DivIVA
MASSEDMTAAELTISNDELRQELLDAEKGLVVVLKENDELKENNNKLKEQLDGTTHH